MVDLNLFVMKHWQHDFMKSEEDYRIHFGSEQEPYKNSTFTIQINIHGNKSRDILNARVIH